MYVGFWLLNNLLEVRMCVGYVGEVELRKALRCDVRNRN